MIEKARRTLILRAAAALGLAALFQVLYTIAGHRVVQHAFEIPYTTFLFNLIPDGRAHALPEYLRAADRWFLTGQLVWLATAAVIMLAPVLEPAIAVIYASLQHAAAACARRPRTFLSVGALVITAVSAVVARSVLLAFPNSGDEYCYLYQTQTFLAGRLSNTPHALQPFFETRHIIERNGQLFSVFPPGWPLVLAGALSLRIPVWMVTPLLSAALFVVTFLLARDLENPLGADGTERRPRVRPVISAVLLCASSFFLLNSASYFSHTLCALLVAVTMWLVIRLDRGAASGTAILTGAAMGLALITRYYTPLVCVLPMAVWFWKRHGWSRDYLWFVAGATPFLGFLLYYNHALTGSALMLSKSGVESYDRLWFPPNLLTRGIEILLSHLALLALWTPAAFLVVFAASLRRAFRDPRRWIAAGGFACLVVGLFPYVERGGNQYGPRFYFDGLPLFVIAVTSALFAERRFEDKTRTARLMFVAAVVSLVAHVPVALGQLARTHTTVVERTDLYQRVAAAGISGAMVFVRTPVGSQYGMVPTDLTRNGVDFTGSVWYVLDRGDENRRLVAAYPARRCYVYDYDPAARAGRLAPCAE